jgi:dihydrofolate reductase
MQAPGQPDEDRRGGFKHGGWATPYNAMASGGDSMTTTGGLLFGRRTYEDFYAVWPNRTDDWVDQSDSACLPAFALPFPGAAEGDARL